MIMNVLKGIFVGMLTMLVWVGPVMADNGCEDEANDAITAELALCSTHAYNIGKIKNPTGAEKELMRDVIAMKSTLITQQMYKQYEQMESMLRRLKTQLEKAVLTVGQEKKGATLSDSTSGTAFVSTDRNVFLAAGVRNCNNELLPTDVMTCLNENMNTISNLSGNADNISLEVRKQLVNDFKLLDKTNVDSIKCTVALKDSKNPECLDVKKIAKKKDFQECFDNMRACLRDKSYALSQASKQQKKD